MNAEKIKMDLAALKAASLDEYTKSLVTTKILDQNINLFKSLEFDIVKLLKPESPVEDIIQLIEMKLNQINKLLCQPSLALIITALLTSVLHYLSRCIYALVKTSYTILTMIEPMRSISNLLETIVNQERLSTSDVFINVGIVWALINLRVSGKQSLKSKLSSILTHTTS